MESIDAVKGKIIVNVDPFRVRFLHELNTAMAIAGCTLRSLEDGSFQEKAYVRKRVGVDSYQPHQPDEVRAQATRNCFKSVIDAFLSFLDRMISFQDLRSEGFVLDRDIVGEGQLLEWVEQKIEERVVRAATDTKLTNPKKLKRFSGLSSWSVETLNGYFALRRCLVHHSGVATRPINLRYKTLALKVNGREVQGLPATMEAGDHLGVGPVEHIRSVQTGEKVRLTEDEIVGLHFTMIQIIEPEVAKLVIENEVEAEPSQAWPESERLEANGTFGEQPRPETRQGRSKSGDRLASWIDQDYLSHVDSLQEAEPTMEEVRSALAGISGSLADEVRAERDSRG